MPVPTRANLNTAYPGVVLTSLRAAPMKPTRRVLTAVLVAFALFAVGCSGSDSQNVVPLDAPPPGVLYVSTAAGDLQVVTPASSEARVVATGSSPDQNAVVDLAPAPNAAGLQALVQARDEAFTTSLADVTESGFRQVESASTTLSCLDPHANASIALAHDAASGDANGVNWNAIGFGGDVVLDVDLLSIACPRWTADRDTVATAILSRAGDPSSIVTIVQTSTGARHEVGFDQCGTTPTSFSPNDEFLVVALTCYAASWENSGLYLVPVNDLADLGDLSALTKLGSGLFGRTSWHPNGDWIAAAHADAIEQQNIAQDLRAQPVGLQVIEVTTLQTVDLALEGGAEPFSVTWLETAIDS